jgi:uncharacterized protein (TIGR02596 family)
MRVQSRFASRLRAFSLIELLAVMAVIVVLMALTIPAFNRMARSSSLSTAGQSLVDALNLARQTAVTKNVNVEVRLYELPSSLDKNDMRYRALQVFLIDPTESDPEKRLKPVTRIIRFPEPVVMSDTPGTSSILDNNSDTTNKWALPEVGANYKYASFLFRPTGETDLDPKETKNWLATLIVPTETLAADGLPANYFTARIDFAGKVTVFRP